MASNKITYSSELMQNFLQGEIISPQKKFEALQTDDGYSLLFSIGTDNVFYLTEQQSGQTSGWEEVNLSEQIINANSGVSVTIKTFAVSQDLSTGKINLALIATIGTTDQLYLSLNNTNVGGSITKDSIQWTVVAYDDPDHQGIDLNMANVYISETKSEEYIVVDLSRSTFKQPSNFINRYYIDSAKSTGKAWNNMVIGGDLEPGLQSCMGRKEDDRVDATYTLGTINGETELVYAPLYNAWDKTAPPTITRLGVPQGASAISSANVGNNSTALFVAANKTLYYFAANAQNDGDNGMEVLQNDLFEDASALYAFASDTEFVVWGLNRADQIFYTTCARNKVTDASMWSVPIPVMIGVEKVSPYVNRSNNGNVFFAVAGDTLRRAVQSPSSTIWSIENIRLEAPVDSKAQSFDSYTTRIQLTDEQDQPIAGHALYLSASTRTPYYINHLYYILDIEPIPVLTDVIGSITLVQEVDDITGTIISVSEKEGTPIEINPMNKPFGKVAALNTADKLQDAKITYSDGTTKRLVSSDVSQQDLEKVAQANVSLTEAYAQLSGVSIQKDITMLQMARVAPLEGFIDAIVTDVGDLFKWLETGIEHVLDIVKNTATGFWHFVVKIGEEIYQGVLDCVEKVIGAIRWVFDIVKTAIKDLIKFLSFLFEWDDITRTQEVLKNISKLMIQHEADEIEVVRKAFDTEMGKLISSVKGWAGINDLSGLGAAATSPTSKSSTPVKGVDAPGTLISHHFQNNAGNMKQFNPSPPPSPDQSPIDTLFDAIKNEGDIIGEAIGEFETLIGEYKTLDLESIIKRIVGILADAVLESAQNVIDAMLDILFEVASEAIKLLDTPVYIPVVSDILESFGVPRMSLLDMICWIAAVPVTIAYKIGEGSAPFADDEYTEFLSTVTDYETLVSSFKPSSAKVKSSSAALAATSGPISMPENISSAVFITGHMFSGFFTLMNCFIASFEAGFPTGENPFAVPSAVLGVLSAGSGGITGVLVPKDPVKDETMVWIGRVTTGSVILSKLLFSGPAQTKFGASEGIMKNLKVGDGRAVGALVNSILIIPAIVVTCWHFGELAQDTSNAERSASIIGETANITSYISRLSYFVAVNDEEPDTKAISIAIMAGANVITAGLETAESIVGA